MCSRALVSGAPERANPVPVVNAGSQVAEKPFRRPCLESVHKYRAACGNAVDEHIGSRCAPSSITAAICRPDASPRG